MTPQFLVSLVTNLVVLGALLGAVAYGILLERKIAAWIQDRLGPNRVGPLGLLQPMADGLKLLLKEDYTPPGVDKPLFYLAPVLAFAPALIAWAVIPWGGYWHSEGWTWPGWLPGIGGSPVAPFTVAVAGAPINLGAIYILAVGSLAVYGVVVGGYAANNKYAFLGSLRGTAQMLSYEIPLGLAVLTVILMAGSADANLIVSLQANSVWFIVFQPLLAIIFFTSSLAETNRAPFDLPEAEQELVAGYHTEYSSMKFGMFMLGEYMHIITGAAFFTVLFLGGWDVPILREPLVGGLGWVLFKCAVFAFKVFLLVCLVMVVRWTLPRFRFDQLMRLAWRSLIPLVLVILLLTGGLIFLHTLGYLTRGQAQWGMLLANAAAFGLILVGGKLLPEGPPVNRRVPLAGSRFSPA